LKIIIDLQEVTKKYTGWSCVLSLPNGVILHDYSMVLRPGS
jgi:hypothetical protein